MTTSTNLVKRFRRGDLVLTDDGYYGIIVTEDSVLLGNGCEEILDDLQISRLKQLPINVSFDCGVSNFLELIENRTLCQEINNRRRCVEKIRADRSNVNERC